MSQPEWSRLRHDADLQLDALQAVFTTHAFARHWHDYYVIGLVVAGAQTFACRRATYTTPRGGVILINPGEAHTGEATSSTGFAYRALYPTAAHMAPLMAELGRPTNCRSFRRRASTTRLSRLSCGRCMGSSPVTSLRSPVRLAGWPF